MSVIERLRALAEPIEGYWGDTYALDMRDVPPVKLLSVRPMRFASVVLNRVKAAGAPFDFGHLMKRLYRDFRSDIRACLSRESPFLSILRQAKGKPLAVQWGGNLSYWDSVTKTEKEHKRPRFWVSPYTA